MYGSLLTNGYKKDKTRSNSLQQIAKVYEKFT